MSWFSRLLALFRTGPGPQARPDEAIGAGIGGETTRGPEQQPSRPADEIRLALDFGTSTTLLAAKIGSAPARLLPLEGGRAELPSYIARLPDGRVVFGREAIGAGSHVHSIKLKLRDNPHVPELGCSAAEAAHMLIDEAVRRGLTALRAQGSLGPDLKSLVVAMNVGCTPAFNLEQRLRLRDICLDLGIGVTLVNLVEEPVAAAFEIGRSGAAQEGRTMIVDIGGGTLDVAVMRVGPGGADYVLHATRGAELGGDRFTQLILSKLSEEVAADRVIQASELVLTEQEKSALWNRAEAAKVALSSRDTTTVALLDGRDFTLERAWFLRVAAPLILHIMGFVGAVYQQARLTLDRGGVDDPNPGGATVVLRPNGTFVKVQDLRLDGDGREHLDVVCLVGGASHMPALRDLFDERLPGQMFDPAIVGIDVVQAVALGLGRHQTLDRVELMRPNWQVLAIVRTAAGEDLAIEMYKPFEAVFQLDPFGPTSSYSHDAVLPADREWASVALEFRPIARNEGARWESRGIPSGTESLTLTVDLFGRVRLTANGVDLYPSMKSPFAVIDWLPPKAAPAAPEFCQHKARRGQCDYVICPYHSSGGIRMYEE